MANSAEVLMMLIPQGGWITRGNDYDGITFLECDPISKETFEAGFAQVDAMKAEAETTKSAARQAVLDRLGITAEEAQLILGGSN
jgi:hypothetical protein